MTGIRCPPPVALLSGVLGAAAAVMASGYLLDLVGLRMHPLALGCAAGVAAVAGFRGFRHAAGPPGWGELAGFGAVVVGLAGYLLWRAWPALLPVTDGPDVAPVIIAALLAKGRVPLTRPSSPIATSAYEAGLWARDNTPSACVDYFSRHWLTGYWLHLDVLGNPRVSDRMRAESFRVPR